MRPSALAPGPTFGFDLDHFQDFPLYHRSRNVITDPLFYLVVVPAVTFLGLGKGGFAGVGMVATPLLALYMPPLQAAALLLPILFVQDAISVWTYRHHWDAWNVKVMLSGAAIGVAIAWALASYVADAAVRLLVGAIGVAQAGAPPFQVFVLPQQLPKFTLVGTNVVLFAAINVLKLGPYIALGQFSAKGLATSAVLVPLAVATNFLGIWLVRITPTRLFYRIAYVLVFLISLALIWMGAAEYWPA
jgi:uncharacterized protein